jgi:hypothetical protein
MTIRFTGAMVCGAVLVLATTTGGVAQTGGWTPSASATAADMAEHAATVRAEVLFGKCKQHYGVIVDGIVQAVAPNSRYAACMRNGGKRV